MSEDEFSSFMAKEVYDLAAQAGSALRRTDRTQVSQLIEVFQGEADVLSAASLLVLHIARQVSRGEIPNFAGRMMIQHVSQVLSRFKNDRERLRLAIEKYLTLSKWVFETRPQREFNNFQDLIGVYVGGGR
jgi:hypothetical protein